MRQVALILRLKGCGQFIVETDGGGICPHQYQSVKGRKLLRRTPIESTSSENRGFADPELGFRVMTRAVQFEECQGCIGPIREQVKGVYKAVLRNVSQQVTRAKLKVERGINRPRGL